MTLFEIAMFKRYCHNKGIEKMFIGFYGSEMRIPTNPESVEKYLRQAAVENVYLSAFYFITNADYGYKYWHEKQEDFLDYVSRNSGWIDTDSLKKLSGIYKYLRQNYDSVDFWRKETKMETARRIGIQLIIVDGFGKESLSPYAPDVKPDYKIEASSSIASNNDYSSSNDTVAPENDAVFDDEPDEEEDDFLKEFALVTPEKKAKNNVRLAEDEISINRRHNKCSITFNQTLTKEIRKRGGYEYAAIRQNSAGDVCIVLNDQVGVPTVESIPKNKKNGMGNTCVNSKSLINELANMLHIEYDYCIGTIKEVKKTNDYVAYQIIGIKQK